MTFLQLHIRIDKMFARATMYRVLLPLVILGLSSTAMAVDIIFYQNSGGCDGSGYSFNGASARTCCIASGSRGSVLFTGMDGCKTSVVYKNGGCDRDSVGSGTGNRCYVGGGFTSGYWYQSCRRRSLLADVFPEGKQSCQGKSEKPTGIVFTENSKIGTWILNSSDSVELLAELDSLSHGEKANWLEAKGAAFHASTAH